MVMQVNFFVVSRQTLKYLGVKEHHIYNLLLKASGKITHIHRLRAKTEEIQQMQ